jgi:chromosome segregation ATPase
MARRDARRMTDNDRIAKLQAQIDKVEAKQTELYEQLAEARLDQWKGRLEDLEVQVHLGAMDTNDRVAAVVQRARDRWDDAKTQLGGATAVAADVVETVRGGFESALDDVRRALLDAKKQASS